MNTTRRAFTILLAETWGWSLEQGATMLQTDYGAELLVYLNNIGRHTL